MALSLGEGRPLLHVRFEELVCEVLGEEGEHQAGALGVWDEVLPDEQLLCQHLDIRQLFLPCGTITG